MLAAARALALAAFVAYAREEDLASAGVSVEVFQGAQIVVSNESEVAQNGTGRWMITVADGCHDSDVQSLQENMPNGTTPVYLGHPDKGGLCLFVMTGTKAQVMEELASHNLPMDKVIAEADEAVEVDTFEDLGEVEDWDEDSVPWGLDRIDQRRGLDEEYYYPGNGGEGVTVFVFDSGIACAHEQFEGRAIPYLDLSYGSVDVCKSDGGWAGDAKGRDDICAEDFHGHGTHCAGTIGGSTVGVAPNARLMATKVLRDDNRGYMSWWAEALDQVMSRSSAQGKVVSMSLGGGISHSVDAAVTAAVGKGFTVVASAGNKGRRGWPAADACKQSPGRAPAAITVASIDNKDKRSVFSNWGSCVDIFAPGSRIVSADGRADAEEDGLALKSGTSMACPHVSGAAALLLGENKKLSPYQVRKLLLDASSKGIVKDSKTCPNKLLYVGDFGEEEE